MAAKSPIDCLIVGAGLSGLVLADTLQQQVPAVRWQLLEARARPGGRILTVPAAGAPLDLGPTWFWPHQPRIQALLYRLGVAGFPQYESGAALFDQGPGAPPRRFLADGEQETALRVAGGMSTLVARLLARLPAGQIAYGQAVRQIVEEEDALLVRTAAGESYRARRVVVTLPPRLASTLAYEPTLPLPVSLALEETQTWMGQAMKVALAYERPFWRAAGLSGLAVSYAGPVQQFHDASPAEAGPGALFGWLGNHSPARALTPAQRREAVIAQAARLFGADAAAPQGYAECNWQQEPFTSRGEARAEVAQPSYGHPLLQEPQMNGRLHWAATEVSPVGGGYLEGAVYVAETIAAGIVHDG